jgi:hypothetical protein
MRSLILSLLCCISAHIYAQPIVPMSDIKGFMQLPLGMDENRCTQFINKQWPQNEEKDTGPLRIYIIGKPDNEETLSGTLRLLVYYMGYVLGSKEMRLSLNKTQLRPTLDSMQATLVKEYGKPDVDSTMTMPGYEGSIKVYSWSFKQTGDKDVYRVDLAAYKLKSRTDYTILAAVFTNQFQKMLPVRNYLHN